MFRPFSGLAPSKLTFFLLKGRLSTILKSPILEEVVHFTIFDMQNMRIKKLNLSKGSRGFPKMVLPVGSMFSHLRFHHGFKYIRW